MSTSLGVPIVRRRDYNHGKPAVRLGELGAHLGGRTVAEAQSDQRLSQVQTMWTVVCQAHGAGTSSAVRAAQEQLLVRYRTVVLRYLHGALRDAEAAEELTQEFSLRFVRGDLKGVDRQRGRFRDYLKGALSHLIGDFYRRQKKKPLALVDGCDPVDQSEVAADGEQQFLDSWRAELLQRAWERLAELQRETGQPFHQVLHFRAAHPEMRSAQMAEQLGPDLGHEVSAAWVRQNLHRARERFADFLLEEVRQTLDNASLDQLEDELLLIGLHSYCQPALEAMRSARNAP